MIDPLQLARPELLELEPYRHAAWEPALDRLHANELPWRPRGDNSSAGLNRYPEPQPRLLCQRLANLYGVRDDQVLVGRGSDEAIDLLVRAFCRADRDSVMIFPPTFGMYAVAARIQGAGIVQVPLDRERDFALDAAAALDNWRSGVKLLFVCSPNNPTGTLMPISALEQLCLGFAGKALVVVDEAYVEFATVTGCAGWLERFPHLVVLRTLSKAFALAGARCGTLIAHPDVVALLRRLIPPYAIPTPTLDAALAALESPARKIAAAHVEQIVSERRRLVDSLSRISGVRRLWPSAANFILAQFADAPKTFAALRRAGLLVRDVSDRPELPGCLRLTVGTPEQNDRLLRAVEST